MEETEKTKEMEETIIYSHPSHKIFHGRDQGDLLGLLGLLHGAFQRGSE